MYHSTDLQWLVVILCSLVDCCIMCESVLSGALTNVCAATNGKQAARTITYTTYITWWLLRWLCRRIEAIGELCAHGASIVKVGVVVAI